MVFFPIVCLLAVSLLAPENQEKLLPQNLVERAISLRETALKDSKAYDHLASLTKEVGHRFAGSDQDPKALKWALSKFKEMGLKNVRAEKVKVPCWIRGEAFGEVTLPSSVALHPLALGGCVGTPPGGVEAKVIEVTDLKMLARLKRSHVAGKIVFFSQRMRRTRDGRGYGEASPKRRHGAARAGEKGAAAVIIRSVSPSNHNFAHTGATHYEPGIPKIPAVSLSNPEADLLAGLIGKHKTVRVKLKLGCQYLPDVQSANVIGEIPGRVNPNEVVLLAAHLDSWDVGQGAQDDGAGCAIILEAARLINQLKPAPRRTLRVWFAANEEFGLSGGLAYSKRYATEMDRHVMALESDFGADKVIHLRSRMATKDLPKVRELALLLKPLGVKYVDNYSLGGADFLPMVRFRVPCLELRHDATHYFDHYHSGSDTLDKVNPENLRQCVAAYAVAALVALEMEEGFVRAPKFRGKFPAPFDQLLEGKEMYR